jgi:hypothetical protein
MAIFLHIGWARLGVLFIGLTFVAEARAADPPRIMFYHDGRHPLMYMYEPAMEKEELESAVDELVGTPVDALM